MKPFQAEGMAENLTEGQVETLRHMIEAIPWRNKVKCHVHEWAMVAVIDHKNLDPLHMLMLGQQLTILGVKPQAVRLGAPDGSQTTALIMQRLAPGIPIEELEHFMHLILMGS